MNRTIIAGLIASMSVTLAAPMAAAWGGDGPRGADRIQMLDTDGDGEVTLTEAQNAFADRFAAADTDGDGVLSQSEMVAEAQSRAAERAQERFATLDTDGNGEISQAEMPGPRGNRIARLFDRLDANDDDVLTSDELENLRALDRGHGRRGR